MERDLYKKTGKAIENLISEDKTEQNIKKNMQKIVSFFIFPLSILVILY